MKHSYVWLFGTVLLTLWGCEGVPRPTPAAETAATQKDSTPILTSSRTYALRREGILLRTTIPFRFTNTSSDTLYIVNCNGALTPEYEKRSGAVWESFLHTATNSCLSSPITIAPGAVLADTILLVGALPGYNAGPAFRTADVTGEYRMIMRNVRWHYDVSRPQFGDTVPMQFLVSNSFRLEVAQ